MKLKDKSVRRIVKASTTVAALMGAQLAQAEAKPVDAVGALIHKLNVNQLGRGIDAPRLRRDAALEQAGKAAPADLLKGIDLRLKAKADMRPPLKVRLAEAKFKM